MQLFLIGLELRLTLKARLALRIIIKIQKFKAFYQNKFSLAQTED
jgi:hypothetical protein